MLTAQQVALIERGPLLRGTVGIPIAATPYLGRSGHAAARNLPLDLLIDTGASHTVIREELILRLGVPLVNVVASATPATIGGQVLPLYLTYKVRLTIPGGLGFDRNHEIIAMPLGGVPHHGVIGRDILSQALLVYDGRAGAFNLTF